MECNTVWLVVSTIGLAIFDRRNFNAPRDIEAASVGGRFLECQVVAPLGTFAMSAVAPLSGGLCCKTRKYRLNKILAEVSSSPVLVRDTFLERIGGPLNESV